MTDKPMLRTREHYDYDEIISYIEKKYDIDVRDYAKSYKFDGELKALFIKETGIHIDGNTQFISPEYKKFIEFACKKGYRPIRDENSMGGYNFRPYLDFWHWMLDRYFNGVGNGSLEYLPVQKAVVLKDYPDAPEWVLEIFEYLEKEYGTLPKKGDEGRIPVLIDW